MNLYCPHCAARNEYSGVKPKTCKFCGKAMDALAGFKSTSPRSIPAGNGMPAMGPIEAAHLKGRINRWGSEGNIVMSEAELAELGDIANGETLESIGLDAQSFAAKVEGDVAAPMTVESLRASSATFTRPTLSPEMQAIQAEALKHMLKGKA